MYYGECKGGLLTAETALNKIALSNTPYFKGSKLDAVEKQLKKKANDKKNELKQQMSKYKSRKEKEDQQEQYNYMMELADRFRKEYQKHPDSRYLSNDQLLQRTLQLVQKGRQEPFLQQNTSVFMWMNSRIRITFRHKSSGCCVPARRAGSERVHCLW
jgi:hypothetical protein